MKERLEMVKKSGFDQDVTEFVINELKKKPTKLNGDILKQIEVSSYYMVLTSKDEFTIFSKYRVNKYEYKKISKILNLEYTNCGSMISRNGLWDQWIKLP